jgi:hypothetical protein
VLHVENRSSAQGVEPAIYKTGVKSKKVPTPTQNVRIVRFQRLAKSVLRRIPPPEYVTGPKQSIRDASHLLPRLAVASLWTHATHQFGFRYFCYKRASECAEFVYKHGNRRGTRSQKTDVYAPPVRPVAGLQRAPAPTGSRTPSCGIRVGRR